MESNSPPLTQETNNRRSEVQYAWIILFHYSIHDFCPFSIIPLAYFLGSDFPWNAVEGILNPEFRMERRTLSKLSGGDYTIFAKVEVGKQLFKKNLTFF